MSEKKPMVLVLAGPNGSGKSTITQYFDKIGTYTNADDIVAATGMSNQEAAEFVDKGTHGLQRSICFCTLLSFYYITPFLTFQGV